MLVKYKKNSFRKINKEERTAEFVISDATIDRHGTMLDDNWELERYHQNPVVGYMHQVYGDSRNDDPDTVIGTSEVFWEDDKLIGRVLFEPVDINPLAEKIFKKVSFGTLRAASVGFKPLEEGRKEKIKVKDQEVEVFKFGRRELLEWSIVKIPSNWNAVKRSIEDITGCYEFGIPEIWQERPYENEHSARIKEPGGFNPDTFRRTKGGKALLPGAGVITIPSTISIIWGKLKGADKPSDYPIVQALRFPKENWTGSEAKKWLSDNKVKYISFEAATESKLYFLKKKLELAQFS